MRKVSARFVLSILPKDGQDGRDGQDGADGVGIEAIQVANIDRTLIYNSFEAAAAANVQVIWMRMKFSNMVTWTPWLKIVGEDGANGPYTDYSFAISEYLTTTNGQSDQPPQDCRNASDWHDGPIPTTTAKPYLWVRATDYDSDGNVISGHIKYFRLTGEKGADGQDGEDGRDSVDWEIRPSHPQIMFAWNKSTNSYQPGTVSLSIAYYKKVAGVITETYNKSSDRLVSSGGAFNLFRRFLKTDGTYYTGGNFHPWCFANMTADFNNSYAGTYSAVDYCISSATESYDYDATDHPNGLRDGNIAAIIRIPIIANGKDGHDGTDGEDGTNGQDGRSILAVTPYYVLSKNRTGVTISSGFSGTWVTNFLAPTWDNPYLWRYYKTTYNKAPLEENTPPELLLTYSTAPNENLLQDTGFDSTWAMSAWDIISKFRMYNDATAPTLAGIIQTGTQAHMAYYDLVSCRGSVSYLWYRQWNSSTQTYDKVGVRWKEVLRQKIWTSSSAANNRIEGGKWYTLSFWIKSSKDKTSTVYYTEGADDTTTFRDRRDWFEVNLFGDNNARVWNTNVKGYVDGVETTFSGVGLRFTPTTSWTRHTITFQTLAASTLGSTARFLLFRGYTGYGGIMDSSGNVTPGTYDDATNKENAIYICMPKLEEGLIATSYMDNAVNRLGAGLRPRQWSSASVQYFRGAMGEPFQDVVYYEETDKWYECIQTHVSSTAAARKPNYSSSAYWKEASGNFDFVATKILLARNAYIRLLTGNAITLAKQDGTVTAGMSGVGELDDSVRFWAGAATPSTTAPFAVTQDGTLNASKLKATGGEFNGIKRIPAVKRSHFWVAENDTYLIPSTVAGTIKAKLPIAKEYIGREITILHSTGGAYNSTTLASGSVSVLSVAAEEPTPQYTRMLGMENPAVANAPYASYGFTFAYGSARLIGMPSNANRTLDDDEQGCTWVLLSCSALSFTPLPTGT